MNRTKKNEKLNYEVHGNILFFLPHSKGLEFLGIIQEHFSFKSAYEIDRIVFKMRDLQRSEDEVSYEKVVELMKTILPIIETVEHPAARALLNCHYLDLQNRFDLHEFDDELWMSTVVAASNLQDADLSRKIKTVLYRILQEWQHYWFWSTDFFTIDHDEDEG